METPLSNKRVSAMILCFILSLCSAALAATPKAVLSGPSQASAGDVVMLTGMHFTAGDTYTVKTVVGKRSSQELVVADSDGGLSYQLVTSVAGTYQLQIRDNRNRLITTSLVSVNRAGG
ncbi:hypothetical protein WG68_05895 [Arsukibacterium ikkense]|uniref:IPT/TIG domain-containing protein n=1 Tax=Arsukibacterium ikkense TaxID=336831 RepID=A0A0M2V631_9GAMM|nr:hypothetical protein [Arsukibacterium ikkense]KKO46302.1 hypothetical protein WG68_05895 [Arsukibacterium ikkense]